MEWIWTESFIQIDFRLFFEVDTELIYIDWFFEIFKRFSMEIVSGKMDYGFLFGGFTFISIFVSAFVIELSVGLRFGTLPNDEYLKGIVLRHFNEYENSRNAFKFTCVLQRICRSKFYRVLTLQLIFLCASCSVWSSGLLCNTKHAAKLELRETFVLFWKSFRIPYPVFREKCKWETRTYPEEESENVQRHYIYRFLLQLFSMAGFNSKFNMFLYPSTE